MKVMYFTDTDTLYIKLNDREPVETKEVNESMGNMVHVERAMGLTLQRSQI